jgi:hypothetical protein
MIHSRIQSYAIETVVWTISLSICLRAGYWREHIETIIWSPGLESRFLKARPIAKAESIQDLLSETYATCQGIRALIRPEQSSLRYLLRGGSWTESFQWDIVALTSQPGFLWLFVHIYVCNVFKEWYYSAPLTKRDRIDASRLYLLESLSKQKVGCITSFTIHSVNTAWIPQ